MHLYIHFLNPYTGKVESIFIKQKTGAGTKKSIGRRNVNAGVSSDNGMKINKYSCIHMYKAIFINTHIHIHIHTNSSIYMYLCTHMHTGNRIGLVERKTKKKSTAEMMLEEASKASEVTHTDDGEEEEKEEEGGGEKGIVDID